MLNSLQPEDAGYHPALQVTIITGVVMKSKPQPFCVVARDGIPHSGKERVANPRYIVMLLLALLLSLIHI